MLAALQRLRLERAAIGGASRRQALRFTRRDFRPPNRRSDCPDGQRNRPLLNAPEIIGFPESCAEGRFELIAELVRPGQAEIARITGMAVRLAARFGADIAIEFLYYEIGGRPPDRGDPLGYAERFQGTPSIVPIIADELLVIARSQQ